MNTHHDDYMYLILRSKQSEQNKTNYYIKLKKTISFFVLLSYICVDGGQSRMCGWSDGVLCIVMELLCTLTNYDTYQRLKIMHMK